MSYSSEYSRLTSRIRDFSYVYPVDTRKLLYVAGGVLGVILVAVVWSGLSSESTSDVSGSTVLKQNPFLVGCNFFSSNLRDLVHNQVSKVSFDQNLSNDSVFGNAACSNCQTDLQRLQSGSVSSQFWSVDVPCDAMYKDAVALTLEQLEAMSRLISKYPTYLSAATTSSQIQQNFNNNNKLISSILVVNSGHSIDGRLAVLRTLKTLGVRVMGLTCNCSTDWASSYNNGTDLGLSSFGQKVIKEMNRLGILIDLSEASHQTQLDVLSNATAAPVIFSHTASYSLCNNTRNIKDDVLEILSERTAIVMVTFAQKYLSDNTSGTNISTVIDHLNYFKNKVGVTRVGIGGEFDASSETYPTELSDVSTFPTLFDKLKKSGWSISDLEKLAGGNMLEVLKAAEQYAESHSSDAVDETYTLNSNVGCYSDYDSRSSSEETNSTSSTSTVSSTVPTTTSPTTVTNTTTTSPTTVTNATTATTKATTSITTVKPQPSNSLL